jgi:cobalamin synthase
MLVITKHKIRNTFIKWLVLISTSVIFAILLTTVVRPYLLERTGDICAPIRAVNTECSYLQVLLLNGIIFGFPPLVSFGLAIVLTLCVVLMLRRVFVIRVELKRSKS